MIKINYYESNKPGFSTGDIWNNLPTFNLLRRKKASGIIITPNCDLANLKTDTITYLPIVPIYEYINSRSFYPEIRNQLIVYSKLVGFKIEDTEIPKTSWPNIRIIEALLSDVDKFIVNTNLNKHKQKFINCLELLKISIANEKKDKTINLLKNVFNEKEFAEIKKKIITNSYKTDLHFLPKTKLDSEWNPIESHSICLFRCPITVPIEILYSASDVNIIDWTGYIMRFKEIFPMALEFDSRPLRCLKLRSEYLNDLLTRYLSLYIRLGSQDFSNNEIENFSKEIEVL